MVKQANNLARHLYEQSIHPNIKIGEFYVVLLEGCEIDGEETSAIGLFKSEVNVMPKAASWKPVTRMNVLRLGNDFEVKVLNPNAEIEKGVDEVSGKEYCKLYF